jgi:hypothetical protein
LQREEQARKNAMGEGVVEEEAVGVVMIVQLK